MVNVDALVGYISVIVEALFAVCMLVAKIYLDNWGPYSQSKRASATHGLTIPARARLEMSKFLSGTAGAPFPKMMQVEESHTAAHLLLDCQLEGSVLATSTSISNKTKNKEDKEMSGQRLPSLSEIEGGIAAMAHSKSLRTLHLTEFVDMLETCLDSAELDVYKRQTHAFASFKQQRSSTLGLDLGTEDVNSNINSTTDTTISTTIPMSPKSSALVLPNKTATTTTTTNSGGGGANLCFVPCKDGYCSVMWLPETSTLAVDLVGASPETIKGMNTAAEMFCKELKKAHPGVKIVASAVSRLPAL